MANDYIPDRDIDLNEWAKFMCQYVGSKTGGSNPDWTHIPEAEVEIV
jgi:hypothetical protein